MMKPKPQQSYFVKAMAFTLLEMLIATAIIGLLAALALGAVAQAKQRALLIQCADHLRQLDIGLQAFVTDNNNTYPLAMAPPNTGGRYWMSALEYAELNFPGNSNQMEFTNWASQGVWKCPAANTLPPWPDKKIFFSYGYNKQGTSPQTDTNCMGLGGHTWNASTRLYAGPVHESEVMMPSEMMAMGDGLMGGPDGLIRDGEMFLWRAAYVTNYAYPGCTQRSVALHNGKANVVYCDGHVESPALSFLFDDVSDEALSRWSRDHQPHREFLGP